MEVLLDEFGNEIIRKKEQPENAKPEGHPDTQQAAEEPKQTKISEN